MHVQLWSPDTCGCVLHQLVEPGNPEFVTRYQTWEQAAAVHARCFMARPRNTVRRPGMGYMPKWLRRYPLVHWLVKGLQPNSKLCLTHYYLGYGPTTELYAQVLDENRRKNVMVNLAWMLINDISDEDLAWVNLAPTQLIRKARMQELERVIGIEEIRWRYTFPERQVVLVVPDDIAEPSCLEAIARGCAAQFGPGRVLVP